MHFNRELVYQNALSGLFGELFPDADLISITEPDGGIEAAFEFSEEVTQYNEGMRFSVLDEMRWNK